MSNGPNNPNKRILLSHAYWIGYTIEPDTDTKVPHTEQIWQMTLPKPKRNFERPCILDWAHGWARTQAQSRVQRLTSLNCSDNDPMTINTFGPSAMILYTDEATPLATAARWWSRSDLLACGDAGAPTTSLQALQSVSEKWNIQSNSRRQSA